MRGGSTTLTLPPFPRAIKTLVALNAGIYVLFLVISALGYGDIASNIASALVLRAQHVVYGRVWELVTYSFIHGGFFHVLFNMLMLWMFGSMLEVPWGSRKFWEFYLVGAVGAALGTVVLAYTIGRFLHLGTLTPTIGSSGALYAVYMAVGMLFGNQEVFMFPLPVAIRLKYLVGILAFISFVGALGSAAGGGNVAQLTGLLVGYLYIKYVPRKGLSYSFSEGFYGMTNSYHRWKRRRAAKKFQVYMRKHEHDPKQYFDEYGNFKPPDDKDKNNGGPGGWVN